MASVAWPDSKQTTAWSRPSGQLACSAIGVGRAFHIFSPCARVGTSKRNTNGNRMQQEDHYSGHTS